jgi:hypothetical protein
MTLVSTRLMIGTTGCADGLVYVHANRPLDGAQPGGFLTFYPVAVLPLDIGTGSGRALTSGAFPSRAGCPAGTASSGCSCGCWRRKCCRGI